MSERLYRAISVKLMQRIAKGDFPIGMSLPGERWLASELNVSRAIVREAMIVLEMLGLVEARPGSGNYIIRIPDQDDMALRLGRDIPSARK